MSLANSREALKELPEDLITAQSTLYTPCELNSTQPIAEAESDDYAAYTFELNGLSVKYRIAKITPTKIGQFVTLWKRIGNGPIQPFDSTDQIDLFVISTRDGDRFGQFIFPKSILQEKGIISTSHKEGKRAIRVYPPWDITISKQAQKTQLWQLIYFVEIAGGKPIDFKRVHELYSGQIK
jgi:hypothetical protein